MSESKSNFFSKAMESKSSVELKEVSKDKENYTSDARMAALWELQKREGVTEDKTEVENEIKVEEKRREEKITEFHGSTEIPDDLPEKIAVAAKLLYGTLILGILSTIYQLAFILPDARGIDGIAGPIVFVLIFTVLIYALFFYFVKSIARGRNWARITMLVLFCLSAPLTLIGLPEELSRDLLSAFITIISLVASTVAYVFLFTGEAHQWYATGKTSNKELLDDF